MAEPGLSSTAADATGSCHTPPERQSTLTDPDSALMRRTDAQECRQADNAQAVVRAEGSPLILATTLVA